MSTRETPTHSPAPWATDLSLDLNDATGAFIADVYQATESDRRLILTSPELLAVCRTFVRRFEEGADYSEEIYDTMKALVDHIDGGGE